MIGRVSTTGQPAPEPAAATVAGTPLAAPSPGTATLDVDRSDPEYRAWLKEAVRKVQADSNRSADTHLLSFPLPEQWGVDLYLKDESTHPTGSLKHRLARSLFLYGLCNGWIRPGRPVIEASSGSTAVSEAYFAKLIGVPFIAVMPRTTSREKTRLIEFHGGRCHLVDDPRTVYEVSAALAAESGGHYMDQFTYAERATDWRGNNNIAESVYEQMRLERFPEPSWIVATAGTGGTSATIARYVHYMQYDTRVCVPDPENSCFFDGWVSGDNDAYSDGSSRIEGIGRPRMEPSFLPSAVDRMMKVPDAAAVAAVRALERATGRRAGGSTGTGLWSALKIVAEMYAQGRTGSVVTLLCDPGDRYLDKYYSDDWLAAQGLDIEPYSRTLSTFLATGDWAG
jgi:cysteine synthase